MNNYKKYIRNFFTIVIIITILIIGTFNYSIDPLWTFTHSNKFNNIQYGFNERQQKTNYIYNRKLDNFDGILLGSSRSTFINQNDFYNMKIYNYALASMYPYEYKGYIDFAKEINNGNDFKYIIIGLDFFGTKIPTNIKFKNPEFYIENTKSILYRLKMLFTVDTVQKSIANLENSFSGQKQYYDRNNIKYQEKLSEEERMQNYTKSLKGHILSLSEPEYNYNENYIKILKDIKKDNPTSKFIIFTPPVTADLLVSIIQKANRLSEYKKWLHELIEVFGEVNHFMTINSITKNLQNYPDDDHAYPHVVKLVANKLSGKVNDNIPQDFGIIINKENIDNFFLEFDQALKNYNKED